MYIEPEELDKSIEAALNRLTQLPKPVCTNCETGINMCKHVPCIGTLEEIKLLIKKGYAKNLMLDWWIGYENTENKYNPFQNDVFYLKPAIISYECKKSPWVPKGQCNLLTKDNKCSIHDFKPIQGKVACCKTANLHIYDERYDILRTWNTDEGKQLIEEWKKLVNYGNNNDDIDSKNSTSIFINALDSILDIFESSTKT